MPWLNDFNDRYLTPRGEISAGAGIVAPLLCVSIVGLIWILLSYGGLADPVFFPSPGAVFSAFWATLADGRLGKHIWASLVVINLDFNSVGCSTWFDDGHVSRDSGGVGAHHQFHTIPSSDRNDSPVDLVGRHWHRTENHGHYHRHVFSAGGNGD
jgi:hypothetical protein